ncbi:MAG: DUF4359 domain-containing protein [Prevotella sp.]|nr:DUF4359 domain-containing protein [Prevotella sp.]
MKKLLVLILIVALAIFMVLTCPDKKAHKKAMMKAVTEYIDEESDERGFGKNILTDIGKGVVRSAASAAIDMKLKVDNYYLFNTTHINMNGEKKLLSVGLLGKVITFDKEMLREALEKGDTATEDTDKETKKKKKKDKQEDDE